MRNRHENIQFKEYLDEVAKLEYEEWADNSEENKQLRIAAKKEKIRSMFEHKSFCKLILIDNHKLVGFISFFPNDCPEEKNLTPMVCNYVRKREI